MVTKREIDRGTAFDCGKTSPDYAVYRPGYPASFFTVLQAVGIGRPGQHILDVGTGTGALARAFAQQGADVIGIDIAEAQIVTAQQLATQEHLDIRFMTCAAEPVPSWATWASCASAVFPYRANPMPPV